MDHWTTAQYVFTAGVVLVTAIALYWDLRFGKIPNALTLPFFALGWVYQFWSHGPHGLVDGLEGFALGFGTYFVLWIIAGGGGGDTKLMGAISVWLGFKLTLLVIVVSTVLVAVDLMFVTVASVVRFGLGGVRRQYSRVKTTDAEGRPIVVDKRHRLRFAGALAMAAWLVLLADATIHIKGGQLGP